jgi:hypothetical protein
MAFLRQQEGLDKIPRRFRSYDAAPEANHVHVVILNTLLRRKVVEDQAGSHAWDFVSAYGCTHAASANGDSTL